MSWRATLRWNRPGNPEEKEGPAQLKIHMKKWMFFNGQKRRNVCTLSQAPEEKTPGTLLLSFQDTETCEIIFGDDVLAADFAAQVNAVRDAAGGRSGSTGGSLPTQQTTSTTIPLHSASSACSGPSRRNVPLHDFEFHGSRNSLPCTGAPVRTPADDMVRERELKRMRIDRAAATFTPEKEHRPFQTPRRAPPLRTSLVSLDGPRRPAAPQNSASYASYRSAVTFGGLKNLGNTCYLNAVMQALCSLREFVSDLRAMPTVVPPCQSGELFNCTAEIFQQMSTKSAAPATVAGGGPLSPAKLRERIARASPTFRGFSQQDAHEFLLEYVNQLHDELLEARTTWLKATPDTSGDEAILATQLHLDSEVKKQLVCVQCQAAREVHERFRDFSLDLGHSDGSGKDPDSCSLAGMLRGYFSSELLEAKCEHCGAAAAHLQKQLAVAPKVLVLHLKRFVPNLERQRYEKQHQSVDIPARLDLAEALSDHSGRLPARPFAAEADAGDFDNGLRYDLRAMVAHEGDSPNCGHYTCCARSESGAWRFYDDSLVQELGQGPKAAFGRTAYLLFYVQQTASVTRPLSIEPPLPPPAVPPPQ
mmetsp:Transcript_8739/g.16559  ORF Transcript_8739/g.16559 Transcript_8739/m.16559 type:complete len:590 (+) Transcript_8739:64-1833(+)